MLTTAEKGIPYPEDDDPIASYPAITQALAQQVEDLLKRIGARFEIGKTPVSLSASTVGSAAVSFTAGRFTTAPVVVAMPTGSTVFAAHSTNTPTASGFNLGVRQVQGTAVTTTVTVHWIAIQF